MEIVVYGSGCVMCSGMGKSIREAIEDLDIKDVRVDKVCDPARIEEAGVKETPALSIDGEIVVSGKIPDTEEMKEILKGR